MDFGAHYVANLRHTGYHDDNLVASFSCLVVAVPELQRRSSVPADSGDRGALRRSGHHGATQLPVLGSIYCKIILSAGRIKHS